jgi:hypothetical protein
MTVVQLCRNLAFIYSLDLPVFCICSQSWKSPIQITMHTVKYLVDDWGFNDLFNHNLIKILQNIFHAMKKMVNHVH